MSESNVKPMTDYRAVSLVEGMEEGDEDEILEAWQYLHDTRLAYQLQGAFGRQARAMVEEGLINE